MSAGRFRVDVRDRDAAWRRIGESDVQKAAEAVVKKQITLGRAGRVLDLETGAVVVEREPASWRRPADWVDF